MAAAAGKNSTPSLSLFVEARGLEVEEELSTMANQYWKKASGQMVSRTTRSVDEANSRSSDVETGEKTCKGSGETRDLGKKAGLAHIDFQ